MKAILAAIIPIGLVGLGGAFAVYGSYADSLGGTLLGILVALGAMVFSAKRASRDQ
jgi:hypothetical protein